MKWLIKGILASVLISFALIPLYILSIHQGFIDFGHTCVFADSTICGDNFGIRLIENKWLETYANGKIVSAQMTTVFDKPMFWILSTSDAGDDFSTISEFQTLEYLITKGRFKELGRFSSQLIRRNDTWILSVQLLDRKERIEFEERKVY